MRPRSNLNYRFTIDGPAGMTVDDDFYSYLVASPATNQVCPFHFAAGPYTCIQQPADAQPVAVAFGPEQTVLRSTPGSWRIQYRDLSPTAAFGLVLRNARVKETVKVLAHDLAGEDRSAFEVTSDCVGTTLKPGKTCKLTATCKPRRLATIYRAELRISNTSSTGTNKIALVCTPTPAK